MTNENIISKNDLNIQIVPGNPIKDANEENPTPPDTLNQNDEYEAFDENKPLYPKRGLFLWYFLISGAIFTYDVASHYMFNPLDTRIESNVDGKETFKYVDSNGIMIFSINILFGLMILGILWIRTIFSIIADRLLVSDTSKRIIRLLAGLITILLLWITIGELSIGERAFVTRTFIFFLIFTNVFLTLKSWKIKTLIIAALLIFSIRSLSEAEMPEQAQIMNYLQSNNIESDKYIDFIKKSGFEVENVTVMNNDVLAFAFSIYIPGLYRSITVGHKLMDEALFESFKGIFIHEFGHIVYYHSLINLFTTLIFFGTLFMFTNKYFKGIRMESMIYGICIISIADKFFSLCLNIVGQYMEYQADNFININDPSLVIPSMYALVKSHADKSNELKFGFFYPLYSPNFTHPSVFYRIKSLGLPVDTGLINLSK